MSATLPNQKKSAAFPIIVGVIILVMVLVVGLTIMSGNSKEKAKSKQEFSETVSVVASSVNSKLGPDTLSAFSDQGSDPDVGKIVPSITGQDFAGKDVSITPGEKPYVIAFIAHWCPHCQKEVPKLVGMYHDKEIPEGVDVYAVATGTTDTRDNYPPSKWLLSEQWPWPVVADTEDAKIAQAFGLAGYPYMIYVNADGTLYKRTSGEQDVSAIQANMKAIASSAKNKS